MMVTLNNPFEENEIHEEEQQLQQQEIMTIKDESAIKDELNCIANHLNIEIINDYSHLSLNDLQARGRYSQSLRSRTRKKTNEGRDSIISFYSDSKEYIQLKEETKENNRLSKVGDKIEEPTEQKKLISFVNNLIIPNDKLNSSLNNHEIFCDEPQQINIEKKMETKRHKRHSIRQSLSIKTNRPKSIILPSYATPAIIETPATPVTKIDPKTRFQRTKTMDPNQIKPNFIKAHQRSYTSNNKINLFEQVSSWEEAKASWKQYHRFSKKPNRIGNNEEEEDKVLIGTRVGEGHANYTLMYNMLTGIRVSVSRCSAKPMKELTREDFMGENKLAFDVAGNELVPSSKYDFKFKDYAPNVFRKIRTLFGIDPSDYLMSLTHKYIVSELFSPGKSRSFFYYSRDYRFIIKTIHHVEHRFMRKILPEYYKYVQENPNTLLTRIYGLHRVKVAYSRKIHFVVMANIFPPDKDIHESYDLKGSTLGRIVDEKVALNNPIIPMKDLNWLQKEREFSLGPEKKKLFLNQLEKDAKLLKSLKIMDYSLLVGVHFKQRGNNDGILDRSLSVLQPDLQGNGRKLSIQMKTVPRPESIPIDVNTSLNQANYGNKNIFYKDNGGFCSSNSFDQDGQVIYYFGIIDILTPYNYAKKVEHYWKAIRQDRNAISAVHPKIYANRFLNFISEACSREWESVPSSNNSPAPEKKSIRQRKVTLKNRRKSTIR